MLTIVININPNIVVDNIEALQQKLFDTLTGLLDHYGITDTLKVDVNKNMPVSNNIAFIYINDYERLIAPYYLANSQWHYTRNKHVKKKASESAVLTEVMFHNDTSDINQFLHDYI